MSDDPITFDRLGTVTFDLDGLEVKLKRPTFKQWRHFSRSLQTIAEQAQTDLEQARQAVESAKTEAAKKKAEAKLEEVAAVPFYERTIPWMQDVFAQLGNGTPVGEPDDWPAWLAVDHTLPGQIITHWRTVPKASGPTGPN